MCSHEADPELIWTNLSIISYTTTVYAICKHCGEMYIVHNI